MRFNITLIGLFVASICLSGFFFTVWRQSEKDNQRNQANFVSLASEVHNFQKQIAYSDDWIDFKATQYQNQFVVERNRVPVPLDQVIFREKWVPKFILPWLWGKRQIYQDVKTKNPWAIIEFTRTINIHK